MDGWIYGWRNLGKLIDCKAGWVFRLVFSVSPLCAACHAPQKLSHRLIGTPNLHLEKRRFHPVASAIRTLSRRLLRVGPRFWAAEDVFHVFFARVGAAFDDGAVDCVGVGTAAAFEAVAWFVGVAEGDG